MTDFELAIFHSGAILGLLGGALLAIVGRELVREFREWRDRLHADSFERYNSRAGMLKRAERQVLADAASIRKNDAAARELERRRHERERAPATQGKQHSEEPAR